MLYDERLYKPPPKTKKVELSIADLMDWLREQDPAETYNGINAEDCAVARYTEARGGKLRHTVHQADALGLGGDYPRAFLDLFAPYSTGRDTHTYGALLRRLEDYTRASQTWQR
jgi:hypothetical protein